MSGNTVASSRLRSNHRYSDFGAYAWLIRNAPCRWLANTTLEFSDVSIRRLQPANSEKRPEIVALYLRRISAARPVPALIVSESSAGSYYIHDGNHRYEAIRMSDGDPDISVRVAVVRPNPGYAFRWRRFGAYETYVLEPERTAITATVQLSDSIDGRIQPLLGRTLVLVAHPDDEAGGCACLLQRMREPIIVFTTDGAPMDEFFWGRWGSRDAYGLVRREEATHALSTLGIHTILFLEDYAAIRGSFCDQHLHECLIAAFRVVENLVESYRPDAILVPAYEGGHPDHDACSFIGRVIGDRTSLPVWEMPLYHRSSAGDLVTQRFRVCDGSEIDVELTEDEQRKRSALISHYRSQSDLSLYIKSTVEHFRPQAKYDYSKPPHEGAVNYEAWGWNISPVEVCRSFQRSLVEFPRLERNQKWIAAGAAVSPILSMLSSGV